MITYPSISFHVSCPYTPEQIDIVERKHHHVVELALDTMAQASIPHTYWDHIFKSIVFLIKRSPSPVLNLDSPYKILFDHSPDYSFFKVLGCLCYPWLRPYAKSKLESRSLSCIFIDYSSVYKGYKCLHLPTNRIYISRYIIFHENTYSFFISSTPAVTIPSPPTVNPLLILSSQQPLPHPSTLHNPIHTPSSSPTLTGSTSHISLISATSPIPLPSHSMTTRTKDNTCRKHPFPDFVTYSTTQEVIKPTCFTQANKDQAWCHAMTLELNALAQNQT
jgi:hypothetical protein